MPRNHFDQASRYAVKLDPPGFLAWVLRLPPDAFAFLGWLDTRNVPFPGDPERTGDSVARLVRAGGTDPPWVVAVEFQIEPDPAMFGRLMVYLGNLWLSGRPDAERGSRFEVGAAVVNLTGTGLGSRRMEWPAAGLVTRLDVAERNMAAESADGLLGTIERGERPRCLLPWIPLMTGGGDPSIIGRWKAVGQVEPDSRRRSDLAGLARVFAEAADRKSIWDKALEGWNVRESVTVKEWIAEGKAEGKAEGALEGTVGALVALIEARFGGVPADLEVALRKTTHLDTLKGWIPLAAKAATLAEFRTSAGV